MKTQSTLPLQAVPELHFAKFLSACKHFAMFALASLLAVLAWDVDAAQATSGAATPFAVVWRMDGELFAEGPSGKRLLQLGDTVMVGERISAGAAAEGVFKTQDAGYIAIRPGGEFMANRFVAEGKPTDASQLELFKGALRIISGWTGKLNRKDNSLVTPTATIGIRGTDHEPYVLLDEDESTTRFKPGTYDKVNQGGTTLAAAGQMVDINPGQVGFARTPGKSRALMTLLFPVLLEKIPDFYVPGKFDAEMNELSKSAEANNQRQLQARHKQLKGCNPSVVAKRWTQDLDQNIVRGDAAAIVAMFALEVRVKATVRGSNGKLTELELDRAELADSIVSAVSALRDYKHRRIVVEGRPGPASTSGCDQIAVRSVVIEQGRQAGKPYRFESEEKYVLQQTNGVWLATDAETRQK